MADEKKRIYVVSDGSYSGYEIKGVFDDSDTARKFQQYHNYDRIEKFDLNPDTPAFRGLAYKVTYDLNAKSISHCYRVDNDEVRFTDKRLVYKSPERAFNGKPVLNCHCLADDQQHAQKIAMERVSAFLAGETHAIQKLYERDQPPRTVHIYRMNDGQIIHVGTEQLAPQIS